MDVWPKRCHPLIEPPEKVRRKGATHLLSSRKAMPVFARYFLGLRDGQVRKPTALLVACTLASRSSSKYLEF
jgi:hypothetical protein